MSLELCLMHCNHSSDASCCIENEKGQKLLVETRGRFSNRRLWNREKTLAGEAMLAEMTDHQERTHPECQGLLHVS